MPNIFSIPHTLPSVNPLFPQFLRYFFMKYPLLRNNGKMV